MPDMRTASSLLALAPLAVSVLAGCGGSTGDGLTQPGGGATPTGPALADLPAMLAAADCAAAKACYGAAFDLLLGGQDCVDRFTKIIENSDFGRLQGEVDAGKVVYHPENAQGCLDAYTNGGCAVLSSHEVDACLATLDGTVALGGACTYGYECQGKAFCKADTTCPGVCSTRLTAGQACKVDDDCQDGLACPAKTHVCTPPATLGQACKGTTAPDCQAGLFCYGNDDQKGTAGTCKTYADTFAGKANDACSLDGKSGPLCGAGLSCAFQSVDAQGLHASCVAPVASGAACQAAIPSMCPSGEYCNVPPLGSGGGVKLDGTCTKLPADGEACAKALAAIQTCAPGAVCDAGGTCRAIQANGGTCAADDQCWSASCQSGACAAHSACTD